MVRDILQNTVRITAKNKEQVLEIGVGLFLGSYEGRAALLLPTHVLSDFREVGKKDSTYTLEVLLSGITLKFAYANCSLYLEKSSLDEAVNGDYMIVVVPIGLKNRGAIVNLTSAYFRRPHFNESVSIINDRGINPGVTVAMNGANVVSFEIKTDKVIDKGESGSVLISSDERVVGILSSSDGQNGTGVYPEAELLDALHTIAWSKDNRQDYRGFSISLVPTYQYSKRDHELSGGLTKTTTQDGVYTSIEIEYVTLERTRAPESDRMYGFIFGYSDGDVHGYGKVDGADYTLKYGATLGSVDRFHDDSGEFGLFILSHRVNGKFSNHLAMSLDATKLLLISGSSTLDVGLRAEINDLGGFSEIHGALGIGLLIRYTWLHAI